MAGGAPTGRCGVDNCPQRKYQVRDGIWYCKNGHSTNIFVQHTQEDDFVAPSQAGATSRIKEDRPATRRLISRVIGGFPGLQLFLTCYQHLLQQQCRALIAKGFHPDLEHLVRGLWALRLPRIEEKIGGPLKLGLEQDDDDGEAKLFSSQAESTAGETDNEGDTRREKRRDIPDLVDSIALCYVALMLLRCPLSTGELHRMATREEIPFIRPLRLIPADIRANLGRRWTAVLESQHVLQPDELHHSIARLLSHYSRHYSLALQEQLNWQPLLFWYITELALPLQLFTIVRHLISLHNLDFSFPTHASRRRYRLPEAQLVALLVFAVKVYHPFSVEPELFATSNTDPAFLTIHWSAWSRARENYREKVKTDAAFESGAQMLVQEKDVKSMSGRELDSYMDWYTTMWLDPLRYDDHHKKPVPQSIVDMFPIARAPHGEGLGGGSAAADYNERGRAAKKERLKTVVESTRTRNVISEEREETMSDEIPRVGDVQVFRTEEDLDQYPVAREFHEEVAERAAIKLGTLLKEVGRLESKLGQMKRKEKDKEKRKRGQEDAMDVDVDGLDADA